MATKKHNIMKKLQEKSIAAFLLSIEIYNKPTINYRIETSAFLLCNAWELILKCSYIKANGTTSIYRKDGKSFSLEEMLNRFYKSNSPVKINLDYIIEKIRNKATHFFTTEHDKLYLGLFQQAVINYVDFLETNYSVDIQEYIPIESLAIILKRTKKPLNIEKIYGKRFKKVFDNEENELHKFIRENVEDESSVVAFVERKLCFVKNPNKADFKAFYSQSADSKHLHRIFIEKEDVNITYPYSMKQVKNKIKAEFKEKGIDLNNLHYISMGLFNKANNVTSNKLLYKEIVYGTGVVKKYSDQYMNLLREFVTKNPNHFVKT